MRLIVEEIDGSIYGDIILTNKDMELLEKKRVIESMNIAKAKRVYIGIRLGEEWCHNDQYEFLNEPEGE